MSAAVWAFIGVVAGGLLTVAAQATAESLKARAAARARQEQRERAWREFERETVIELQTAMALSGATDPSAHRRYLANTSKARQIPEAALPRISIAHAETPEPANTNQQDFQRALEDSNLRPTAPEAVALSS